jgi:Flp pilus assembly pilin Flp
MRKLLHRYCRDDSGLSAIEFALVATFVLIPLVLGVGELGRRAWTRQQFENAVQSGLDYALIAGCANATTCAITAAGMQNAVHTATALGANITVAPPTACGGAYFCYGCPGGSGVTLSASPTTCGAGGTSGTYAGVTGTYTYTPMFHACGELLPTSVCPSSASTTITWTFTTVARVY